MKKKPTKITWVDAKNKKGTKPSQPKSKLAKKRLDKVAVPAPVEFKNEERLQIVFNKRQQRELRKLREVIVGNYFEYEYQPTQYHQARELSLEVMQAFKKYLNGELTRKGGKGLFLKKVI